MDPHDLRDRIHGCWLGKNVGGTIGGPYEGQLGFVEVPLEYPAESIANDDLDLQLVWLSAVEERGTATSAADLAARWSRYISYPFDEYGVAIANLRLGLEPPATGHYNNWFRDSMGSPIRSELWACLCPGRPEPAGHYALQDAQVDHWGEGVYGEIFLSCLESLAFVERDVAALVARAIEYVPADCKVGRAVGLALDSWRKGETLPASREAVLEAVGHHNFTDCAQNIAFTALGLLHGEGKLLPSIVAASSCGYDVDCTAATAGAVAGILVGGARIVAEAGERLDERIVAGWGITDCPVPATVTELTDRTVALQQAFAGTEDLPRIAKPFRLGPAPSLEPPMELPFLVAPVGEPPGTDGTEPAMPRDARPRVFDSAYLALGEAFAAKDVAAVRLQTHVRFARAGTFRTLPVSSWPVRLWLDGRKTVDVADPKPFLPALHRTSVPVKPMELAPGWHRITIEIARGAGRPLEFAWIVADDRKHWVVDLEYAARPPGA